ncbi:uncharacterized protein LOC124944033 [Impatiens glandulifera]|uniref:uncharacterized protein LOC124944033 n=1 Tax=Impatiens glandulifera TaxID=253017 RepID=UPI001FB0E4C5|nr:uncharacterized protein LOC124944033 [Impatiens glandulifera]
MKQIQPIPMSLTQTSDMQPSAGPLFFNQIGPHVPVLCMPLSANLTEVPCLTGEVNFTNASEVWKGYVCEVSTGICTTPGRITPEAYTELISSLNVSYAHYEYGSFLVDLVDSTYVKETFMDISNNFCPSLRHSTKLMCSIGCLWSRKKASKICDETNEPISSTSSFQEYYIGGRGKY